MSAYSGSMNDALLAILVGLPALALLTILLGYVAYRGMIHYRMRDEAYQRQAALEAGDFDASALDLPWIEEDVASSGGYPLRVHALAARGGPAAEPRLAVFHHGIGWGWLGMIRYMELFRAEGWTVVAYDSRGHGRSSGGVGQGGGRPVRGGRRPRPSYGFYEKEDLRAVADWAFDRFGGARSAGKAADARPRFVVFGESMGAATVLQYAPLDPRLDAVIADCPFSSAVAELEYRLKSVMVPPGIRRLVALAADAFCRRLEGFSLREADPARAILETDVPILFIHGLEDRYVPWRMSVVMAETRRRRLPDALTELLLVPGARHAASIRADKARYAEALRDFLEAALAR
jgi:uncharacterized protein